MKKIIIVFTLITIVLVLTLLYVIYDIETSLVKEHIGKEIIVDVPKRTNLLEVIDKLNAEGEFLPKWKYLLIMKYYTKFNNKMLVAGTYRFVKGMSYSEVVTSLFKGSNQYLIKVTYPEGINYKDFASITEKFFNIPSKNFINYVNSKAVLRKYGINAKSIEGYLYPSTYKFKPNVKLERIVDKLISTLFDIWDENFREQAENLGWSMHKTLTLASIIEAESPVVEERKRISGVYHNRLRKGMLLQADPTVQYALGGRKRVLYKDLTLNNPYNTYKFLGLPPGPINSPGFTAIEAALNPESHNYLYFVARGDGTGKHNFSTNISGHNRFVKQYRRNRGAKR